MGHKGEGEMLIVQNWIFIYLEYTSIFCFNALNGFNGFHFVANIFRLLFTWNLQGNTDRKKLWRSCVLLILYLVVQDWLEMRNEKRDHVLKKIIKFWAFSKFLMTCPLAELVTCFLSIYRNSPSFRCLYSTVRNTNIMETNLFESALLR